MIKSVSAKFKICGLPGLNGTDNKALTLLYLPLIGLDGFGMYFVLTCLEKDVEYQCKRLIDLTSLYTLKQINRALDKLEAIGLLKTYFNSEKGYVFEVLPPLSLGEFLRDDLLMNVLTSEIGSDEAEKLKKMIPEPDKGYKEITKKFSSVFTLTTEVTPLPCDIEELMNKPVIENQDFNYSLFKMLFNSECIDEDTLNDEKFRNNIIRLSYIYRLDEEELKNVVVRSLDTDKKSDYATLSKNARYLFQQKYKVTTPKIQNKKEEESFLLQDADPQVLALCTRIEAMTPAEVLEMISGMKATPSELKIAEDLSANTKLSSGAINFMLMYVAKEKEGELPSYNYFEKIAATWSRAKVKTALEAINYIKRRNRRQKSPQRQKEEVKVPGWYDAYEKGLNKDVKKEPISEELNQLFDSLFEE